MQNQSELPKELMPQEVRQKFQNRAEAFKKEIKETKNLKGDELEVFTGLALARDVIQDESFLEQFTSMALSCLNDSTVSKDNFVDETINYLFTVLTFPDSNMTLSGDFANEPQEL